MRAHVLPRTKGFLCNRTTAYKMRAHVLPRDMGIGGGGEGASLKKAPLKTKKATPPKKLKNVLSPFLGSSEAWSPERILTMVLPTTI